MAGLEGSDHRILAQLVEHELDAVKGQIKTASDTAIRVETKIDMLVEMHEHDSERLDKHLESHAAVGEVWWQKPKVMGAIAAVLGLMTAIAAILGRELDGAIVTYFLGP